MFNFGGFSTLRTSDLYLFSSEKLRLYVPLLKFNGESQLEEHIQLALSLSVSSERSFKFELLKTSLNLFFTIEHLNVEVCFGFVIRASGASLF